MHADIYPDICFLRGKKFRATEDMFGEERVVIKRTFFRDPLSVQEIEVLQESMPDDTIVVSFSDQCVKLNAALIFFDER